MNSNHSQPDLASDTQDRAGQPNDERLAAIRVGQEQYERSLDKLERSLKELEHELAIGEQYVQDRSPDPKEQTAKEFHNDKS